MESKQWTIEFSEKSLKVKDQVKGIMDAFQKVKELGAALAKFHWEDTWLSSFSLKEEIQDVLSILGMTEEALSISEQLHTLHLRIYGEKNEKTIHSMELLSRRLKESGELGKASKLQRKVFECNKENRRHDAPILLKSLFEVTKTLIELGITEEAEQLYRAAIDLQVKLLGEAHVTTSKIKIELAKLLEKTTQTEEANKLFTEIFSFASTWTVLDGDKEGDAKILHFMDDLGSTLENLNRYEDSLALNQQRLKLVEQYCREDFSQLRSATVLVALNLQQFNKFDEAEQFLKRNWPLCTENLKGNDLLSLDTQLRYSRMLRYLAKKEKAEELTRDLDTYYEQVLGSVDDVTDEERYAAWRAWKAKVGEEVVDRLEESYETSEGSDHGSESEEEDEDEDEDEKERYAALGPWGEEMMRTFDMRNAGISEGSGHGLKSKLMEQR
ncbi:hypothetical protein EAF00_001746 [Botryotinia globosa]|nr:hypothetical protein EAF00_001746 [Botryotinia globosa]